VHRRTARGEGGLEGEQVLVEVGEGVVLDAGGPLAQAFPVVELVDDERPLRADRARGVGEVAPQLGVGQGRPGRDRERRHPEERRWRLWGVHRVTSAGASAVVHSSARSRRRSRSPGVVQEKVNRL
jgi:hypothetical protein